MTEPIVKIKKHADGYAEVILNRPEVLNALNLEIVNALSDALDQLSDDPEVKGLLILGSGDKAFVAGADIGELLERDVDAALLGINARLFQKLEDFPWPTVAVIKGYALGGGCELALACDIRLGADDTVMGQPEVKLGIIPGAGAPHRLTRTVGTGIARELIFTGRLVQAEEAARIGLLNRVVARDQLESEAHELMRSMLKNSPLAVRLAKVAMNAAVNSIDRRHQQIEVLSQGILFESDDKRQRMTRFLERKKARDGKA